MTYAHTKAHVYQPENAIKLKCKQIPADFLRKKIISQCFQLHPTSDRTNAEQKNRTCHALLKFAKKIKLNYRNQKTERIQLEKCYSTVRASCFHHKLLLLMKFFVVVLVKKANHSSHFLERKVHYF
jgi:hypothetical protein